MKTTILYKVINSSINHNLLVPGRGLVGNQEFGVIHCAPNLRSLESWCDTLSWSHGDWELDDIRGYHYFAEIEVRSDDIVVVHLDAQHLNESNLQKIKVTNVISERGLVDIRITEDQIVSQKFFRIDAEEFDDANSLALCYIDDMNWGTGEGANLPDQTFDFDAWYATKEELSIDLIIGGTSSQLYPLVFSMDCPFDHTLGIRKGRGSDADVFSKYVEEFEVRQEIAFRYQHKVTGREVWFTPQELPRFTRQEEMLLYLGWRNLDGLPFEERIELWWDYYQKMGLSVMST